MGSSASVPSLRLFLRLAQLDLGAVGICSAGTSELSKALAVNRALTSVCFAQSLFAARWVAGVRDHRGRWQVHLFGQIYKCLAVAVSPSSVAYSRPQQGRPRRRRGVSDGACCQLRADRGRCRSVSSRRMGRRARCRRPVVAVSGTPHADPLCRPDVVGTVQLSSSAMAECPTIIFPYLFLLRFTD